MMDTAPTQVISEKSPIQRILGIQENIRQHPRVRISPSVIDDSCPAINVIDYKKLNPDIESIIKSLYAGISAPKIKYFTETGEPLEHLDPITVKKEIWAIEEEIVSQFEAQADQEEVRKFLANNRYSKNNITKVSTGIQLLGLLLNENKITQIYNSLPSMSNYQNDTIEKKEASIEATQNAVISTLQIIASKYPTPITS